MSSLFLLPTSFFSYPSVTREGVSRGTRGGDTPPTPCFMASQDDGSGGPEKGGGGCPRSECAISTSVDTPSKINTSIILKVAGCLESRMERTEEAFAGFPAMEPLVEHPIKKERSRKLSDGYRNSYVYFHRDSRLGAEHDGAKGRPVLLEGRRQTVWGRRRERPGR